MYSDNFNSFLRHTHKFLVSDDVLFQNKVKIETQLMEIQNTSRRGIELKEMISDRLKPHIGKPCHILAGGGVDSNVLIAILDDLKVTNVTVWTYLSDTNADEVNNLKKLCKKIGFNHFVYRAKELDFEREIREFQEKYKRYPNDIATPIVGALARRAVDVSGENTVVIDGQYADTYLFANPQNKYFWFTKYCSIVSSVSLYSLVQGLNRKLISHFLFIFSCIEIKILYLSRIHISKASVALIRQLRINSNVADEVLLQVIFKLILLTQREYDKYMMHPEINSPFKSHEIFVQSALETNIKQELPNKKSVYRIMNDLQPEFTSKTKNRSFKL